MQRPHKARRDAANQGNQGKEWSWTAPMCNKEVLSTGHLRPGRALGPCRWMCGALWASNLYKWASRPSSCIPVHTPTPHHRHLKGTPFLHSGSPAYLNRPCLGATAPHARGRKGVCLFQDRGCFSRDPPPPTTFKWDFQVVPFRSGFPRQRPAHLSAVGQSELEWIGKFHLGVTHHRTDTQTLRTMGPTQPSLPDRPAPIQSPPPPPARRDRRPAGYHRSRHRRRPWRSEYLRVRPGGPAGVCPALFLGHR